ncbi:MAG: DUF885 domain-containing protein [Parvularculaceae bacterium]|nr:DUF885 domain-containing protein [Parvularculaceae bacterium]
MRIIGNIILGLIGLILVAAAGAYFWFWATPVGVNNAINKQTLVLAMKTPELLTQLGAIDNTPLDFHSGKLSDYTEANEDKMLAQLKKGRAELDKYGPEDLKGQEFLSWRIATWFFDDIIAQGEIKHSGYRVSQLAGPTVDLPSFLTDVHVIKNEKSVKRYLSRLNEFGRVLGEAKVRVEDDRAAGVTPPDFIIDKALIGMRAFIDGGAEKNALVTTLGPKLDKLKGMTPEKKAAYLAEAKKLVETTVIPGYQSMITLFEDMRKTATHDAGIWRIPNGEKIYQLALRSNTTTDMTADEIHALGVSEVARIEAEMTAILDGQKIAATAPADPKVKGSKPRPLTLAERIALVSAQPGQIFPNDDSGRKAMLDYLVALNKSVMAVAPKYFVTIPKQPLEIVRVPVYSQDSAPGGYYNPPAIDGSRPGRFYINLKDTADNPKWTLPTLLYHEGAPGHHFQISASQLMKNVPFLRTVSPFTAYTEGWALYAERVAHTDMGLYKDDPFGDLGRLQAEMFRAVRLVVDTGMHAKKWSREEAIAYMLAKTGMTEGEVTREIERYVVNPGQACAYKVGQLAILKLRAEAEAALGAKFDLRAFHEKVLLDGAMPLGVLEENMRAWIAEQKGAKAAG